MAQFKTVKDILQSHDFLETRAKSQKYVKNEFQDYAYRLAADLGDLAHRGIYMKLAKTVDRALLEQAAVFALEYFKEPSKGKLFMWKLSQLRKLAQRKQDLTRLDHDFVMKKMAEVYDQLAGILYAKQQKEFDEEREARLKTFAAAVLALPKVKGRKHQQILDLGCGAGFDSRFLGNFPCKVQGTDISKDLIHKAKQLAPKAKIIGKVNFLESSYKPEQFSGIWCARFWPIIPLEAESDYLTKLSTLLLPGGTLYLEILVGDQAQRWLEVDWQEESYLKFEKKNDLKVFTDTLASFGLELSEILQLSADRKGLFLRKKLTN